MIGMILCAILFLVLDDRFFCLKNARAELGDVGQKDGQVNQSTAVSR